MSHKPEVFISYAWGELLEHIVNQLYDTLKEKDYDIIRDKINLCYKGKIKDFMDRIGQGNAIIVVLGDKYLKSKNCMYEALQIRSNGWLEKRIFPIVLADANIYDPIIRLKYIKYWSEEIEALNKEIKGMNDMSHLSSINEELNNYSEIRRFIDEFMSIVGNMNVLTPEIHVNNGFAQLITALNELFTEDQKPTGS